MKDPGLVSIAIILCLAASGAAHSATIPFDASVGGIAIDATPRERIVDTLLSAGRPAHGIAGSLAASDGRSAAVEATAVAATLSAAGVRIVGLAIYQGTSQGFHLPVASVEIIDDIQPALSNAIPVPGALWMLGSGMILLAGPARRRFMGRKQELSFGVGMTQ